MCTTKVLRAITELTGILEVDQAVRAAGKDPTGGRGVNGNIDKQLETARTDEALKSAV